MKRATSLGILIALGMIHYTPRACAQEAEVRAAVNETLAAWNSGDVSAFTDFFTRDTRGFNVDNGLVIKGASNAALRALLAAGFRMDIVPRDVDIKVFGNAAVTIAYLDGTITFPGGSTRSGTWRYSETRVSEDRTWKIVQYHFSQLNPALAPRGQD